MPSGAIFFLVGLTEGLPVWGFTGLLGEGYPREL